MCLIYGNPVVCVQDQDSPHGGVDSVDTARSDAITLKGFAMAHSSGCNSSAGPSSHHAPPASPLPLPVKAAAADDSGSSRGVGRGYVSAYHRTPSGGALGSDHSIALSGSASSAHDSTAMVPHGAVCSTRVALPVLSTATTQLQHSSNTSSCSNHPLSPTPDPNNHISSHQALDMHAQASIASSATQRASETSQQSSGSVNFPQAHRKTTNLTHQHQEGEKHQELYIDTAHMLRHHASTPISPMQLERRALHVVTQTSSTQPRRALSARSTPNAPLTAWAPQRRSLPHVVAYNYPAELPSTNSGSLDAAAAALEEEELEGGRARALREAHAMRHQLPQPRDDLVPLPASRPSISTDEGGRAALKQEKQEKETSLKVVRSEVGKVDSARKSRGGERASEKQEQTSSSESEVGKGDSARKSCEWQELQQRQRDSWAGVAQSKS